VSVRHNLRRRPGLNADTLASAPRKVKTDIGQLRGDVQLQIEQLRGDVKTDIERSRNTLLSWLIPLMFAQVGAITARMKLL